MNVSKIIDVNYVLKSCKREKQNKTQSKNTHKYYSNLILNRYVIKNVEVIKFKDVFIPYFTAHTRKFNFFTVCLSVRLVEGESPLNHEGNVSSYVTYNFQSENYTVYTTEIAHDFLHRVISIHFSHKCSTKKIPGIEIIFVSDPKDKTQKQYLEQPKSMLCGKFTRRFHESTSQDFGYNLLPDSFKNL